jgi:hypothetical protein
MEMITARKITLFVLFALITTLSGCSTSVDGNKLVDVSPKFELFRFFEGDVKAWGIVQNRSGEIIQRFEVSIKGTINRDQLTLDENFIYGMGDGVKERQWVITRQSDGTYQGTAGDILGTAQGISYGNGFNFTYSMDLPVGNSSYEVQFDDWFIAFNNDTIVNRSYIKKFGIVMAEVTIFMQKQNQ